MGEMLTLRIHESFIKPDLEAGSYNPPRWETETYESPDTHRLAALGCTVTYYSNNDNKEGLFSKWGIKTEIQGCLLTSMCTL